MSEEHPSARYSDDERRLTLISVMIVFLLSAMSQTIVATAMPRIVSELKGLHLYAWATTAYLLSSTVMVPIWGKLGDVLGRKKVLLIGIGIFLVGSWLAGLAGEIPRLPLLGGGMSQLIVFRAIQGLGGGALFTTAFAIIADLYAPRERAKFSGLFGAVFGVASIIGPVVGGFFTDHGTVSLGGFVVQGWRWVFYANVPFALAAVFMILWRMPELPSHGRGGRIDYLGAGLIVLAFVPLLLAMSWGGATYPWASPVIVGLFATTVISLVAFVIVERSVWDPILPLELFKNRTFTTANGASLVYSMAFMGMTAFLPLYMQVGQGVPATTSGLTMLALMVGMISSTTVSGQLVTRTGHYKPFMIFGCLTLIVGVVLLAFIGPDTSTMDLAWRLAIVGVGLGPGQSLFGLAVQNAVPIHQLGVATSSGQFVRQIGGTMGVALFGALLNVNLNAELAKRAPPAEPAAVARHLDIGDLQRMALERSQRGAVKPAPAAAAAERKMREAFSAAIVAGFVFSASVLAAGFLLVLLVPATPLREHPRGPAAEGEPAQRKL